MRVVFMGTDDLGDVTLREIERSSHYLDLVVTQPDRPKGRGRKLVPGAVKIAAMELGLPVLQPESLRDESAEQAISMLGTDIIAVASYGEYIPRSIFASPPHGSINLHPSLLPRWRGASPVRYTLLAGDTEAGVTVQKVHRRMDTGDIFAQNKIPVDPDDNHGALCGKLYQLGARLLVQVLDSIESGTAVPIPQNEDDVTLAPKIEKSDLLLHWNRPAAEVRNKIRAFSPDPGTKTLFRGQHYKILNAGVEFVTLTGDTEPGTVFGLSDNGLVVACSDAGLVISQLQPPGKKPMNARDYINGYRVQSGEMFGKSEGETA